MSQLAYPIDPPVAGTGTLSSAGDAVTGAGTAFTTQLKTGDQIVSGSQSAIVSSIADDTHLTIQAPFVPALSAAAFTFQRPTAIRLALRKRLGIYDDAATTQGGLSDTELDECLVAARDELNERWPLWTFSSFQTVALQQAYPPGSGAGQINWDTRKCGPSRPPYWSGAYVSRNIDDTSVFSTLGPYGWLAQDIAFGRMPYVDEMALELNARFFQVLEHFLGARGWEERDGSVWLAPRPQASGINVYMFYPIERFSNAFEVTREYSNALLSWARYEGLLAIAAKQAEAEKVSDGGMVSVSANSATTMALAEKMRRQFNAKFTTATGCST